ncbi:MAG: hypothetical protein SPL39_10310, partial [Selenomonadaceae bacterium]|nr:hypothetical protein [Selenomonadaceae bacterium]
ITCTDSFAKAVCLAASTIAERASDFFFHAGLPTVMGEASRKTALLAALSARTSRSKASMITSIS